MSFTAVAQASSKEKGMAEVDGLVKKFDAALKDKKLSARRDTWQKLSGGFEKLSNTYSGDVAAKAMFYDAAVYMSWGCVREARQISPRLCKIR